MFICIIYELNLLLSQWRYAFPYDNLNTLFFYLLLRSLERGRKMEIYSLKIYTGLCEYTMPNLYLQSVFGFCLLFLNPYSRITLLIFPCEHIPFY